MQYLNYWVPSATLALFFRDSFTLVSNHYIIRYIFFLFVFDECVEGIKRKLTTRCYAYLRPIHCCKGPVRSLVDSLSFAFVVFVLLLFLFVTLLFRWLVLPFFFSSFRSVRLCYLSLLSYYFTLLIFCFLLYFHSFCFSNFVPQWSFVLFLVVRWVGSFLEWVVF